jgi:hypothetical protein
MISRNFANEPIDPIFLDGLEDRLAGPHARGGQSDATRRRDSPRLSAICTAPRLKSSGRSCASSG